MRRGGWAETLVVVGCTTCALAAADLISPGLGAPIVLAALVIFAIGTIAGERIGRKKSTQVEVQFVPLLGLDDQSHQGGNLGSGLARLH